MNNKPRVLKAFEALDIEIQEQIKLAYPEGFKEHLIKFVNKDGEYQSGLPFETEEKYYLVKMTSEEARTLIAEDDDYDDDGNLRDEVREDFEDKYEDDDDL
ncbi:hypothetical protein SAMN05421640_0497 [Ekhidna lutea]|uniref:Uncharacterized protein n=1 Tax=Ekhidna lutea TaxID=447679 RepID=A0A239F5B7_EKHLU|nr:hypothetical protein [Ekhidna lutea]SNS52015.1 hypothetical protein SAMN05421640_0497 [Ekhidna lutea]